MIHRNVKSSIFLLWNRFRLASISVTMLTFHTRIKDLKNIQSCGRRRRCVHGMKFEVWKFKFQMRHYWNSEGFIKKNNRISFIISNLICTTRGNYRICRSINVEEKTNINTFSRFWIRIYSYLLLTVTSSTE